MPDPDDGLETRLRKLVDAVELKREESPEDAASRRQRERWLFFSALATTLLLLALAILAVALLAEAESRRIIAEQVLPLFVGGLIGYLFGKRAAD